jgi:putative flippase GtrA
MTDSVVSSSKELGRFSRFLAVGAVGTLLDFSVLTMLKLLGLPMLLANSVSFTVGVINNYVLNRLWTFADVKEAEWRRQLAQFTLVSLIGLATNNAIVLSLEGRLGTLLGQPELGYLPAKVIATCVVVFWNYFANRYWTFRKGKLVEEPSVLTPQHVRNLGLVSRYRPSQQSIQSE